VTFFFLIPSSPHLFHSCYLAHWQTSYFNFCALVRDSIQNFLVLFALRKGKLNSQPRKSMATAPSPPPSFGPTGPQPSQWADLGALNVVVVGAGMGGLFLGALLERMNIDFVILERNSGPRPTGELHSLHFYYYYYLLSQLCCCCR